MKFQLHSDVHLEFGAPLPLIGGEVLLLSGDIMLGNPDRWTDVFTQFIEEECNKYRDVFYIMGNHEYYHGTWQKVIPDLKAMVEQTNIQILNNESVDLGNDIVLWGGTMWTSFYHENQFAMLAARQTMNDYRLIFVDADPEKNWGYGTIDPQFIVEQNKIAFESLKNFVEANKDKKVVVMSHHGPTRTSVHPRFESADIMNSAYVNEYDQFIMDNSQIKIWVHGHTHDSHDYTIGETRVLCNPRGYMRKGGTPENAKFNPNFEFEV